MFPEKFTLGQGRIQTTDLSICSQSATTGPMLANNYPQDIKAICYLYAQGCFIISSSSSIKIKHEIMPKTVTLTFEQLTDGWADGQINPLGT